MSRFTGAASASFGAQPGDRDQEALHIALPPDLANHEGAAGTLAVPVPHLHYPATITLGVAALDREHARIVDAVVSTLGTALARSGRVTAGNVQAASVDAGNLLSELLMPSSIPEEVRALAVEWIGSYLKADHCLLFDANPDLDRFPGIRTKTHSWSREPGSPVPHPADLMRGDTPDHVLVSRLIMASRSDVVLAVYLNPDGPSWDSDGRRDAHLFASIVEQHLNRVTRRWTAAYTVRNLQTVQQITVAASGASDLPELCRLLHDAVRKLVPLDTFLIGLRPQGEDIVTMIYRAEGDNVFPQRNAIPPMVKALELARPMIVDDILEGTVAPENRFGNLERRVRSVVSAPMISKKIPIGLIVAQSYEPGKYDWETADLLQAVASSVVGTFERLVLVQQIERQTRHDIGLRIVAERLGKTLDTEELLSVASGVIFDTIASDLVLVMIQDRQTNRLRSVAHRSVDPDFVAPPPDHSLRENSLTFAAITTGDQMIEPDYLDSPYAGEGELPWLRCGTAVATPIAIDERYAGVILLTRDEPDGFQSEDLSLQRQIAAMLSTALQNTTSYADRLRHADDLLELQRVGVTIGAQLDLQKSLDEIVHSAPRLVDADSCAVGMLDGAEIVRVAAAGELALAIPERVPAEGLLVQAMLQDGTPIVITDRRNAELPPGVAHVPDHHARAWLTVPLMNPEGDAVGILTVLTHEPRVWTDRDRSLLATLASSAALAIQNARHFERTRDLLTASVESLAAAVEAKDLYTQNHSRHVARYARKIAEALGLDTETVGHVELAGLLHDVGKIGIPDSVLEKPGPLDSAEWAAMQLHPVIGEQILAGNPVLAPLLALVRHHHERWDGHGYPDRLRGDDIPIGASIISLAEALDAMTSQRPYVDAHTWDETLDEIDACSGSQFAPHVVSAFRRAIELGAFETDIAGLRAIDSTSDRQSCKRNQALDVRALRIFDEIAHEIRVGSNLDTFISNIMSTLHDLVDVSFIGLYLRDTDSDALNLVKLMSNTSEALEHNSRSITGQGIIGWVADHGIIQNVPDVAADPRFIQISDQLTRSELTVPLTAEGQVIGVLNLESEHLNAFSDMDERLLESTADHLANALHVIRLHERLKKMAVTDALTGLNNHRVFFERLVDELERAATQGTTLAIAILDVNNLKTVNDSYGHLAGDAALRAIAAVLERHRRAGDVVCRYGGDEFIMIFPGTSRDDAWSVLEHISAELRSGEFEIDDLTLALPTASWGVSTYPVDGSRPAGLLRVADERMYLHKQSTRL